ncbi:MAG: CYTH domain-containing protein, partial [Psychrobium sp.]
QVKDALAAGASGAISGSAVVKIIEDNLNDNDNMLKTLGYHITLILAKTRSMYFVGDYHITFDHLDGLGYFAEFAIMTDDETSLEYHRKQLIVLAEKFGLTRNEEITTSYRQLVENTKTMP